MKKTHLRRAVVFLVVDVLVSIVLLTVLASLHKYLNISYFSKKLFKEMLADGLRIIVIGGTDEPQPVWRQQTPAISIAAELLIVCNLFPSKYLFHRLCFFLWFITFFSNSLGAQAGTPHPQGCAIYRR